MESALNTYIHPSLCHPLLRFWCAGSPSLKCSDFMYPIFVMPAQNDLKPKNLSPQKSEFHCKITNKFNFITTKHCQTQAPPLQEELCEDIKGLPGIKRIPLNKLVETLRPLVQRGLKSVLIFSTIPDAWKDGRGSAADSIAFNPGLEACTILTKTFPRLLIACDLCLCNFTTHGHCGLLRNVCPKNDDANIVVNHHGDNDGFCKKMSSSIDPIDMSECPTVCDTYTVKTPSDSGCTSLHSVSEDLPNAEVAKIECHPEKSTINKNPISENTIFPSENVEISLSSDPKRKTCGSHYEADETVSHEKAKILKCSNPLLSYYFGKNGNDATDTSSLPRGFMDNFASVARLVEVGLAYAHAGAHIIAPSDMMDGRVGALKRALIAHKLQGVCSIMSYSAKFASALYGPFRDAVGCKIQSTSTSNSNFTIPNPTNWNSDFDLGKSEYTGKGNGGCIISNDRSSYQLPVGSSGLAVRALDRDISEGADILMVKPGSLYLDVVRQAKTRYPTYPLAVYHVSGEYAMLYHASQQGALQLEPMLVEIILCMKRAGADFIITYFTPVLLEILAKMNDTTPLPNEQSTLHQSPSEFQHLIYSVDGSTTDQNIPSSKAKISQTISNNLTRNSISNKDSSEPVKKSKDFITDSDSNDITNTSFEVLSEENNIYGQNFLSNHQQNHNLNTTMSTIDNNNAIDSTTNLRMNAHLNEMLFL